MKHGMLAGVIVFILSAPLWADTNAAPSVLYSRLDIAPANLPAGCLPANCSPHGRTPRPNVISATEEIRFLCDADFQDLVDYSRTKEMFILCFREKGDIGIYGWRLASQRAAKAMFAKVSAKYPDDPTVGIWRTGDVVVLLWRDDRVSDPCFDYFKQHVSMVVGSNDGGSDGQRSGR